MDTVCNKKADKRQRKYERVLLKDTGISPSHSPTKCLMIGNVGLANCVTKELLWEFFRPYGTIENIIMPRGCTYSFVVFLEVSGALNAFTAVHGKLKLSHSFSGPLYLLYTCKVPEEPAIFIEANKPEGLIVLENFVTEDEEQTLLSIIDWNALESSSGAALKHRKVKHYGYEFRYDINNVDKDCPLLDRLPEECSFLTSRLGVRSCFTDFCPDQLTVNLYQPGQGIPGHVDTHSAFDDPIISLSLGSSVVMNFTHLGDGRHYPLVLPRRSLLIMSKESRYAWSHGITPRTVDIVPAKDGGITLQKRGVRTSFTFRCIRKADCDCNFHQYCDSQMDKRTDDLHLDETKASELESIHVHNVYEEIAPHFSDTRHKPWPNVLKFVQSLEIGSILVDVGCGNGKYFGHQKHIFEIGCDRSMQLAKVCEQRGFEVFTCDCLLLPLHSNIADGVISIAVIHHLATKERRLKALKEIIRVLKPNGQALIYVWAKNQERGEKSSYLKQDRKNRKHIAPEPKTCVAEDMWNGSEQSEQPAGVGYTLPVHANRTQFQHKDLLVPWKLKSRDMDVKQETIFYRYYHVFEEGELELLCKQVDKAAIIKSYYDQGNWCVVLLKH